MCSGCDRSVRARDQGRGGAEIIGRGWSRLHGGGDGVRLSLRRADPGRGETAVRREPPGGDGGGSGGGAAGGAGGGAVGKEEPVAVPRQAPPEELLARLMSALVQEQLPAEAPRSLSPPSDHSQ
jgi:hypothetical protein